MRIDRCVCFQKTFGELRNVARANSCTSVKELQDHSLFGANCKMCHPYIERMLITGETVFHEILTAETTEKL